MVDSRNDLKSLNDKQTQYSPTLVGNTIRLSKEQRVSRELGDPGMLSVPRVLGSPLGVSAVIPHEPSCFGGTEAWVRKTHPASWESFLILTASSGPLRPATSPAEQDC